MIERGNPTTNNHQNRHVIPETYVRPIIKISNLRITIYMKERNISKQGNIIPPSETFIFIFHE
jgi:hypothetical protein